MDELKKEMLHFSAILLNKTLFLHFNPDYAFENALTTKKL